VEERFGSAFTSRNTLGFSGFISARQRSKASLFATKARGHEGPSGNDPCSIPARNVPFSRKRNTTIDGARRFVTRRSLPPQARVKVDTGAR
jgi:hypothetical protein